MARETKSRLKVGLISDTHGLMRSEALCALAGVHRIIHAGDIGGPEILARLREIAPVDAVRGNNDTGAWAASIPLILQLELAGVSIHVLHDVKELEQPSDRAPASVVVSGHSHRPVIAQRQGRLFINPGSAGPRRFSLPVSVGYLELTAGTARGSILKIA